MTKLTTSQQKILQQEYVNGKTFGVVNNDAGEQMFPLIGAQIRSGNALADKGFGRVVSSSRFPYHAAGYFFILEDGFRFNWVTNEIEEV